MLGNFLPYHYNVKYVIFGDDLNEVGLLYVVHHSVVFVKLLIISLSLVYIQVF